MRQIKNRIESAGWLIGLMLVLALAAGCGEDESPGSVSQQADGQGTEAAQEDSGQRQRGAEPTQQQESSAEAAAPQPVAEHHQEDSSPPAQTQQSQSQTASSEEVEQVSESEVAEQGSTEQQQAGPQSTARQDQSAERSLAESVPAGTRVVSLFGDITEIIFALGAQEHLIARDASSIYPPEAETLPNLGFAGSLNVEAILEYEPSLVIGTPLAGPPGVLEQLRQAGVEVLIIEELNGLDAPSIKIRIIGETLGIVQRAEDLALDVEQRIAGVVVAASNHTPLRVMHIYIRRGGLQLVSGRGNGAQTMIEAAGGVDAAAEAGIVGWQPLTPEALVAADPDVYLVMDRGLSVIGGVEGLLEIPGVAETRAGRGQHIISMPDLYLLGFGPRLPEAIADLAQFLSDTEASMSRE
jgi:iron complex transport system substrate-binding protein